MEDINLNGTVNGGNGSDDEVLVDEDEELAETKDADNIFSSSNSNDASGVGISGDESKGGKVDALGEAASIQFDSLDNKDSIGEILVTDWARWGNISGLQVDDSGTNPFLDHEAAAPSTNPFNVESTLPNGMSTVDDGKKSVNSGICQTSAAVPSLFEEDIEFVGVEPEGTERAMEQALKEGIVREAGPLKKNSLSSKKAEEKPDKASAGTEFNDANYWRVEREVAVLE